MITTTERHFTFDSHDGEYVRAGFDVHRDGTRMGCAWPTELRWMIQLDDAFVGAEPYLMGYVDSPEAAIAALCSWADQRAVEMR